MAKFIKVVEVLEDDTEQPCLICIEDVHRFVKIKDDVWAELKERDPTDNLRWAYKVKDSSKAISEALSKETMIVSL